jgi:hypothetical protein
MGAVTGLIARWLPADIPVELFVGWAVWLLGGLLLMLWFTRQSAARRVPPVRPAGSPALAARRSGRHAVAQASASPTAGTSSRRAAAPVASVTDKTPKPPTPIADAYSELSLLLDSGDDESQSNS